MPRWQSQPASRRWRRPRRRRRLTCFELDRTFAKLPSRSVASAFQAISFDTADRFELINRHPVPISATFLDWTNCSESSVNIGRPASPLFPLFPLLLYAHFPPNFLLPRLRVVDRISRASPRRNPLFFRGRLPSRKRPVETGLSDITQMHRKEENAGPLYASRVSNAAAGTSVGNI